MKIKAFAVICKKYENPISTTLIKDDYLKKAVNVNLIFTDKKDAKITLSAVKKHLKINHIKEISEITPCEIEI